jgi:hypothetical protein
VVSFE